MPGLAQTSKHLRRHLNGNFDMNVIFSSSHVNGFSPKTPCTDVTHN